MSVKLISDSIKWAVKKVVVESFNLKIDATIGEWNHFGCLHCW